MSKQLLCGFFLLCYNRPEGDDNYNYAMHDCCANLQNCVFVADIRFTMLLPTVEFNVLHEKIKKVCS